VTLWERGNRRLLVLMKSSRREGARGVILPDIRQDMGGHRMNRQIKQLLILGTGKFAEELADLVSDLPNMTVAAFIEHSDPEQCKQKLVGLPVLWIETVLELASTHVVVSALTMQQSDPRVRIIEKIESYGIPFVSVIHPSAWISSTSSVGEGTILSVNTVVASHTRIGRHVRVNRGALIGHHNQLEDHVTVGPGAAIASSCRIGKGAYIGIGAAVREGITIGQNVLAGAGAVIIRDVPANVKVVGVPARIIKENVSE
jgi:sugar O-acyltransferase (sialic acid O-acetyltransferase NeuD family)